MPWSKLRRACTRSTAAAAVRLSSSVSRHRAWRATICGRTPTYQSGARRPRAASRNKTPTSPPNDQHMTSPKRARSHQHDEDDRYQILATASLTLSGARVLKHGDTFAVFDRYGDIRPSTLLGSEGLYHEGARYLSVLRMRIETERLLLLSSTVREDNVLLAVDLMNPDLGRNGETLAAHGTLHV